MRKTGYTAVTDNELGNMLAKLEKSELKNHQLRGRVEHGVAQVSRLKKQLVGTRVIVDALRGYIIACKRSEPTDELWIGVLKAYDRYEEGE